MKVRAKKHLGQHFLREVSIAEDIANLVAEGADEIIEIGPGMGVMTRFLYEKWGDKLTVVEIDSESVTYLKQADWAQDLRIVEGDFLSLDVKSIWKDKKVCIIGNYPYNISTQIVFMVVESGLNVVQFCGMFQKEVAERLVAGHGNKDYGITSVLLQANFSGRYCFTVGELAFDPPPKVKSGVIDCRFMGEKKEYEYKYLKMVVKAAFSQRRKTLWNALKTLMASKPEIELTEEQKKKRAEELSVEEFEELAKIISNTTH